MGATLLALVVASVVALIPLGGAGATVVTCGPSTVALTSMHSPDGTQRPFYGDFGNNSTKHSGYVGYELSGASGVLGGDVWLKLSDFVGGSIGLGTNQSASIPARATSQAGHQLVYAYLKAASATTSAQTWTVQVWNGKPNQSGSSEVCQAADGFTKVVDVISASANKITSVTVSTSAPALGGSFQVSAVGDTGTMGAGDASDRVSGNGVFSMAPAMSDSWPADAFSLTGVQVTIGGTTTRDKLRIYPGTSAAGAYTAVYKFAVRGRTSGPTPVRPVQNIASGTQVKYTGSYDTSALKDITAPSQTSTLVKSATDLSSGVVTYRVVVSNTSDSAVTLDYVQDTPTPNGDWTFTSGSTTLNGSVIPNPVNSSGTLIFGGPFAVPAANGSTPGTLTFEYKLTLAAAVSNSVVGSVGGETLGASSGTQNQVTVDPTAPIITTAALAGATKDTPYSTTLDAGAGTPPYTLWQITSGSLPAGLSLNGATGEISGTPTATGAATFTVQVTDSASKLATKSLSIDVANPVVADTTAPTGSVSLNGGAALTNSTGVTLSLSATDAVGVTAYRVTAGSDCSSATWVAVAASMSYSDTGGLVLPPGDGAKTVCAEYKDAAGNVSPTATASITVDATSPSVVLSTIAPSVTNAAFVVTATFSEAVTGLALGAISVTNGSASNLAGSGTTYTFTVTPGLGGTVAVDLPAAGATDAAGNGSSAAAQLIRTYDATRPAVTLTTGASDPTNAPFAVSATFSEPVSGFSLAGVVVGNGTASGFSGSGTTFTFTVTPAADGQVTVDVPAAKASDGAGNSNTAATQLGLAYDATRPSVTLSSPAPNSTNAPFVVNVTFSESVTGFTLADISVGNGAASSLSGSGTAFTFTVTPASNGTVTVDIAAAGAADPAGNTNTAAAQLVRSYDSARPSVTLSTTASDPTNTAFVVSATFSKPVTGLSLPEVTIGNGVASNLAGSGAVYTFTVTASTDGVVTVDLADGSAADDAGNTNLAANRLSLTVDRTAPQVALTTAAQDPLSGKFRVEATFSEPVTGFSPSALTVTNGSVSELTGAGSVYSFSVTPLADGPVSLRVTAGVAADAAGNPNTASNVLTRTYDYTPPAVTFTETPPLFTTGASATFIFTVTEPSATSCSLDGAPFASCTNVADYTALGSGTHTFAVRAIDATGNESTARYTWTIGTPTETPDPPTPIPPSTTPPLPSAAPDVTIAVRVSKELVVLGELVDLEAAVRNKGDADASDVGVTIRLPDNVELDSSSVGGLRALSTSHETFEVCKASGRVVTCRLGALPVNMQRTIVLKMHAIKPGAIVSNVTLSAAGLARSQSVRVHQRALAKTTMKMVTPSDVLFAFDSCVVSARGQRYLASLRPLVGRAATATVSGFTDSRGSRSYNHKLSLCRARAVVKQLFAAAKPTGVRVLAYGEARAVASNATSEGRRLNRRVELTISFAI